MGLLPSETLASVRTAVARATGALVTTGTVIAPVAWDGIVSDNLQYVSNDAIKGCQIVPKSGTSGVAGNDRLITAYTAASNKAVVTKLFVPTPVAGDTFDIYDPKVADKDLLDLSIKLAIEEIQDKYGIMWEDEVSIVGGNVLQNAGFEDWLAGTTTVPTAWLHGAVAGGTIVQDSTMPGRGRYSANLLGGTAAANYIYQPDWKWCIPAADIRSKTLVATCRVYAGEASIGSLIVTESAGLVASATTAIATNAAIGWNALTVSQAISAAAAWDSVRITLKATTAKTALFSNIALIPQGLNVYQYYLPLKFTRITKMLVDNTDYIFNEEVPQRYWDADMSRGLLVFNAAHYTPVAGRHYKLVGEAYQEVPTTDASAIYIPLPFIVAYARLLLLRLRQPGNVSAQYYAQAEVERMKRSLPRRPRANRRMVR